MPLDANTPVKNRQPPRIVDLTYAFDAATIYWPTEKGFVLEFEKAGDTPEPYFYAAANYAAPEHGGTHTDAPSHFNRDGLTIDHVPLADCIGPAAVIDFSARAAHRVKFDDGTFVAVNRDATVKELDACYIDDVTAYEAATAGFPTVRSSSRARDGANIIPTKSELHGHRPA